MKPTPILRRARALRIAACLRLPHVAPRTPSVGLMFNLAAEPSPYATTVKENRLTSSIPFRETRACLPCPGRAAAPLYPAPPWFTFRLTLTSPGRYVAPTSATDPQNEHSLFARLPSPQLALWWPLSLNSHGALAPEPPQITASRPPFDNPNPRWTDVWRRLSSFSRKDRISSTLCGRNERHAQAALSVRGVFNRAPIGRSGL